MQRLTWHSGLKLYLSLLYVHPWTTPCNFHTYDCHICHTCVLYMVLGGRTHTYTYRYMPMCISHNQHPTTTSVQHVTTMLYTGHSHTATMMTTPAAAVLQQQQYSRDHNDHNDHSSTSTSTSMYQHSYHH